MDFNEWRLTGRFLIPTEECPKLRLAYDCGNFIVLGDGGAGELSWDLHICGEVFHFATRARAEKALWDLQSKHEYAGMNYEVSASWTVTGITLDDDDNVTHVKFTASASQIMTTKELCEFAEERHTMRHFDEVDGFPEGFDSVENVLIENMTASMIPAAQGTEDKR